MLNSLSSYANIDGEAANWGDMSSMVVSSTTVDPSYEGLQQGILMQGCGFNELN